MELLVEPGLGIEEGGGVAQLIAQAGREVGEGQEQARERRAQARAIGSLSSAR